MSSGSPSPSMGDIFTLSKQCYQDFRDLIDNLGQADADHLIQLPLPSIESQFGKFRVWCGNLGALQSGFSSLDYRLRESMIMHTNVAELLEQLDSALFECNAVITGRRLPFEDQCPPSDSSEYSTDESEDERGDSPPKELVMRLSSITNVLSDLYRLGHKIRDPKLRPTSNRAILLEAKDPDTGVDLFSQFTTLDKAHVEEVLKGLRQDTGTVHGDCDSGYLSERLAAANTMRRKYFAYWERHAKKLAQSYVDPNTTRGPQRSRPANLQATAQSRSEREAEGLGREQRVGADPAREGGGTVLTKTDATPYDPRRDDETERGTVVSFASTALDVDGKGVELPGPPAAALSEESFTCPYCFVLCPAKQGQGKVWNAHVLHDLQPYVCTYEKCSKSNELYRSRRQWLEHENSAHRGTWRCNDHPQALFSTSNGLKDHLNREHENLADAEIDELLSILSFAHADDRDYCPICLQKPPFLKGLTNHIANHLERVALFALPKNHQDDDADSAAAVAPRGSITTSQASTAAKSSSSQAAPPDTPTPEAVRAIATQLRERMKVFTGLNGTPGERPCYLLQRQAVMFWDDSKLRSILNVYLPKQKTDLSVIRDNCLLAFSLLILVGAGSLLPLFLETHSTLLRDEDFPLHQFPPQWPDTSETRSLFHSFYESQWAVLPIFIGRETLVNQLLGSAFILPIHDDGVILKEDFVTVTKIIADPACTPPWGTALVRKTYAQAFQDQYDRERRAFESLKDVGTANIVRYYGSYRQIQSDATITCNLLMEYVPSGDLGSLLPSMRPPQTFRQVCDLWGAFIGVLDGLSNFHCSRASGSRSLGDELDQQDRDSIVVVDSPPEAAPDGMMDFQRIHQNITPHNLFVSRKHSDKTYPFELKIAGFGFTHTKVLDPGSRQVIHQQHGSGIDFHGDLVYGAPECSHHDRESEHSLGEITTAADIWSLGCVMSETAAWVALGTKARHDYWKMRVNELSELKAFDESGHEGCFHDGHGALKAVSQKHEIIARSLARFDNVTPRVIQMVENHMLCQTELRSLASDLRDLLTSIIKACKEESQASAPFIGRQLRNLDQEPVARSPLEATDPAVDSVPTGTRRPHASEDRQEAGGMVFDTFPKYRLMQSDLVRFLQTVFPEHQDSISVKKYGAEYAFMLPRKLTAVERGYIVEHVRYRPDDDDESY